MSGIAGWVDFSRDLRPETGVAAKMSAAIKHRGAYGGDFAAPECVLTQRAPKQCARSPLRKSVGGEEYTLVFDGALYNAGELRAELSQKGYAFFGGSDAEVLLNGFIEYGPNCLGKLNGVFAFAVWKSREKTLFIARDRIGVKPLYYKTYHGGVLFASEIKALFANPLCAAEMDNDGLKQVFLLGPGKIHGSGVYRAIRELRRAEYIVFDKNGAKTRRYWLLEARENHESIEEAAEHTQRLITESIRRQLGGGEPFACLLSGGLDSSVISYIAAERLRGEQKTPVTFSIDYENNDRNFRQSKFQPDADPPFIDCMTAFIGSSHEHITLKTADIADALADASLARDLPGMADIDSSMLVACRAVKKRFGVCLSGECADEIFGGYPWYHDDAMLYRASFPWSDALDMRSKLVKPGVLTGDLEAFVRGCCETTLNSTDALDTDAPRERRMRGMFMLNFEWFMQNLLDRTDRMAMQSGLNVRVPLCDYKLVEYAFNLPWAIKSADGREKGIMRRAFRGILPDKIVNRKKSPFPKTFDPWYTGYVKEGARAVLNDKAGLLSGLLNAEFIKTLFSADPSEAAPWYGQLMRLPQLFAYIMRLDTLFKAYSVKIV